MAQRRNRVNRWSRTGRWGIAGAHKTVAALACAVCLAGGLAVTREVGGPEVLIERAETSEAADCTTDSDTDEATGTTTEVALEPAQPQSFVVHVDGAVGSPGIVHIEGADARVYDAVEAAGGLTDDADTSTINLAEPLSDGAKIHVPHLGEVEAGPAISPAGQFETSGATGSETPSILVNINTAGPEELQTLSGVGEATARAIIEDRARNGPFTCVEDLMRVSGIGEKKFDKIEGEICV